MENTLNKSSIGSSSITEAMGARITIDGSQTGMFLVMGNSVSPERAISAVGGSIALKLSAWVCLATMSLSAYLSLQRHREIKKIGPVSLDIERFNRVIAALAGNAGTG